MREITHPIDGYELCGESARLIPVVANSSHEQKAVSVTLAAVHAVEEFGKDLLRSVGAPARKTSRIDCYTEIKAAGKKTLPKDSRPDGLIVIRTGKKSWAAIVEAKVRGQQLTEKQITDYVDLARAYNVQAVITISNDFAPRPSHHPVNVSKRKLGKLELYHWSWTYIMTEAVLKIRNHGIADRDQAYLLAELVRYLSHDKSGISGMDEMPSSWASICDSVRRDMRLTRSNAEVREVVNAWQELTRYVALEFSMRIGRTVTVALPSKHVKDPNARESDDIAKLCDHQILEEHFEVPDAAAKVSLTTSLKAGHVSAWMEVKAPRDRKQPKSCVTWILGQLKKVEGAEKVQVYARFPGRTENQCVSLDVLREDKQSLLEGAPGKMPTAFAVQCELNLGNGISRRRKIVGEITDLVLDFYVNVGQHLRTWIPTPPQVDRPNKAGKDANTAGGSGPLIPGTEPLASLSTSNSTDVSRFSQEP
ncbi:MAG: hypothetical protein RJQ08_14690 [Salinisphaeraceae bacterium]